MKPTPDYPGYNLEEIDPTAIAFVNQGANKKKFFLFKQKEGNSMEKQMAIGLIKSGNLSADEIDAVVASVAETDQAEVKKVADEIKKSSVSNENLTKLVETIVEKVGSKISKDTMTKLNELSATLKGALAKIEALVGKVGDGDGVDTKKGGNADADAEKELSEDEANALIKAELEKEEGSK